MTDYGSAIRHGFVHLLTHHPEVFCIGQGLWSPWYVGNTMTDLEKQFGKGRIIDTPVSELATTGAAVGAALCGFRPVVVHPRIDFMLLATDQIVTQAAYWSSMFGGDACVPVTVRGIINRGGEQGAQHSQALHAWFAHVPGLRVVMPATVADARDLLVASVLCDDPVLFIDDRWLYDLQAELPAVVERDLRTEGAAVRRAGTDVTLVGAGFSAELCRQAAEQLATDGISAEVVDLRIVNPIDGATVAASVARTRRLVAVDGGYGPCGLAGEIIAQVACHGGLALDATPVRVTLPFAPAPTSAPLERAYYPDVARVVAAARATLGRAG
jgi:pyruvate dehydrogenase E1 component beta subunit